MKFVRHTNIPLETLRKTHCIGVAIAVDGMTNYIAILEVESKKVFVEEILMPRISVTGSTSPIGGASKNYNCKEILNEEEWRAAYQCFHEQSVFNAPQLDKKVIDYWNSQKGAKRYEPYGKWKWTRTKGTDRVCPSIRKIIEDFRKETYAEDPGGT